MVDIWEVKDIAQEARYLQERALSMELVEVLVNGRAGTPEENAQLKNLFNERGDKVYAEVVYRLTHLIIHDADQAKKIYKEIINHRSALTHALKRPASIQVAALDYMQNVVRILRKPIILEQDKVLELARKAVVDDSTRTYDGKLLLSDLDAEIERARRSNSIFSLIFFDVDDFKKINDTWGHLAGDEILRFVTDMAWRHLRKFDSIYRYGGDEFVLLLPNTDSAQARQIAERIQTMIQTEKPNNKLPAPTLSMGVATFGLEGLKDRQSLLAAADVALYEAKRQGKAKVSVYHP